VGDGWRHDAFLFAGHLGAAEVHYPHFRKPWFGYVPKDGDESTHPEWFGASLVEMIRNARPEQEIGFIPFRMSF